MELIKRSYSPEAIRYKVVHMLEQNKIYITVEDIQAIAISKEEDRVLISIYLRTIEIEARIYKDDNNMHVSIYPLVHCEC